MKTPELDALVEEMPRWSPERYVIQTLRRALSDIGPDDSDPASTIARNALTDAEAYATGARIARAEIAAEKAKHQAKARARKKLLGPDGGK